MRNKMEMNHVLVVEDDKEIREGVEIYLKSQGYEVFQAADGVEGLEVIEKEDIHLAIVDIMMPRMDGISMVVKLREKYDFPVIFLSAKSEEVDKIMGLNMGADDYVTKPFTPMELLARVNSQLRRYRRFMEKLGDKEENSRIHTIGGLEINEDNVEVSVDGEPVKMTPIEYKILLLLVKNPGRVFSASEIQCAAFVRTHTNSLKGQRVSSKEMMSISDLEKITGIRYFENVPNAPKTSFKASEWGL